MMLVTNTPAKINKALSCQLSSQGVCPQCKKEAKLPEPKKGHATGNERAD
jgi:hypothetical protein